MFRQTDSQLLDTYCITQVYIPLDDANPKWDSHQLLFKGCEYGSTHTVLKACTSWQDKNELAWAFRVACEYGHLHIAKYLVERGVKWWTAGLFIACQQGQHHIIDYILETANIDKKFLLYCHKHAKNYGHREIAQKLLNLCGGE